MEYHNVFAGESEIGQLFVQRVEEGHASGDVQREADGLGGIDHQSGAFVQDVVQRSVDHILIDDDQVGRVVATADDGQHVRVREDAQSREFLVEIARNSGRALAHRQEFGHDVVALPSASP